MKILKMPTAAACVCLLGAFVAHPAVAQDQVPDPTRVPAQEASGDAAAGPDIVVTALRRNERLQEAPASISVLTGDTIRTAGVTSLDDVSRLVPSLRFEGGIRPGVPSIALRGISAVQGGDAPVSILVDGVQLPFLSLARSDLLDISSIEILRGPQGALYGRGAIAGALLINTRQPDNETRIDGRFTVESGNDYRAAATISGPIIADTLAAKISGSYQTRDGLLRNVTIGGYGDYADIGTVSGELLLTPAIGTRVQLTSTYTRGRLGTNNLVILPDNGPSLKDFDSYQLVNNFKNYDQRRIFTAALKIDQETSIGTLGVVAQYARARDYVVSDLDYGAAATRYNYNPELDRAINIDARLTSKSGQPFTWTIGAFYQYRIGENYINALPDPAATTPQTTILSYDRNTSRSWAGYAQGTLKLPANFSVTGAVRYDTDARTDKLLNVAGSDVAGTFSAWQPSGTLKWQATPDLMLYGTYSKGFRSGGFNAANLIAAGAKRTYGSEISRGFELGFKSSFADRRIVFNADFFRTDYDNTQFQRTIITPVSGRFITSIAKSHAIGGEADLNIRATDDLTVSASASISKTRIDDFDGTSLFVGNRLPGAFTDNEEASIQYRPALNANLHALFRVEVVRRGDISYDLENVTNADPATFVNGRIGIEAQRWSLTGFVENLTDKRTSEFIFPAFIGGKPGRLANQPFRVGIELQVHFGK